LRVDLFTTKLELFVEISVFDEAATIILGSTHTLFV
jgi:hypothetical protein